MVQSVEITNEIKKFDYRSVLYLTNRKDSFHPSTFTNFLIDRSKFPMH